MVAAILTLFCGKKVQGEQTVSNEIMCCNGHIPVGGNPCVMIDIVQSNYCCNITTVMLAKPRYSIHSGDGNQLRVVEFFSL